MPKKSNELQTFFSSMLTAITWSWKWQFKCEIFLSLSLFWFKPFQLLDTLFVCFYKFKKMVHNGMFASLCLIFYAFNIRITCIIACVRVSLLMLQHFCAPNKALLHGIPGTFVIVIILCRVDKFVTTSYFQDPSFSSCVIPQYTSFTSQKICESIV